MMKTKLSFKAFLLGLASLMLLTPQVSKADCQSKYYEFIFNMESQAEGKGKAGALAGMAAAPAILEAMTTVRPGNIALGVAMAAGIAAGGGSAAYYYYDKIDQAKWVLQLIAEAKANHGVVLYEAATKTNLNASDVSRIVTALDNENAFCKKDGEVALIKGALSLIAPISAQGD
jgi:hypothetical protein